MSRLNSVFPWTFARGTVQENQYRLRRVFLGTNATKIIRHSPVPVLVVPHDEL